MSTRSALIVIMVMISAGVMGCYPDRTDSTWRCYASSDCNQGHSCVEDPREGPGRWCVANAELADIPTAQDTQGSDVSDTIDTSTFLVNECANGTHDCHINATCIDLTSGFRCSCDSGYSGDGKTCSPNPCPSGFTGSAGSCVDINECANNTHNCSANATCINIDGSFSCSCKGGFSGDGVTCTSITAPGTRQLFGASAYRYIPAGTFTMGSPSSEFGRNNDEVQHSVTLSQSFWMKETEVTQGEWRTVMGNNPASFSACGDSCPVEMVSWWDTVQYANTLSTQQGLSPCYTLSGCTSPPGSTCNSVSESLSCTGYRLPTEAEWEYAYRAGTTTALYNGGISQRGCSLDTNLDAISWYCGNASNTTHAVSSKQANVWGLYDMAGNVFEWVWDRYGSQSSSAQIDPRGPASGANRVRRGGSWNYEVESCRAAQRYFGLPSDRFNGIGFRLIRSE